MHSQPRATRRALVVLALLLACSTRSAAQRLLSSPLSPSDFAWKFRALDGTPTTLDAFRGRVIVLTAWATWCEPCVAELRSLQALQQSVRDSGIAFVLVSSERAEPVQRFLVRRALSLSSYLEWSKAPAVFDFRAVPMTWIIDPAGTLVLRHRGARRWDTPDVRAFLDSLRRK